MSYDYNYHGSWVILIKTMSTVLGKVEVVDHGSPERCQYVHPQGQCDNRVVPGTERCPLHVASSHALIKEEKKRNYRLTKLQDRVNDFADNQEVKSLREEIGIARLVLEEILNRCQDGNDIVLFAPRIADMVLRIEKLVSSCHRLEERTGVLIDKGAAITIAVQIIDQVALFVTDPDTLEKIGTAVETMIQNQTTLFGKGILDAGQIQRKTDSSGLSQLPT